MADLPGIRSKRKKNERDFNRIPQAATLPPRSFFFVRVDIHHCCMRQRILFSLCCCSRLERTRATESRFFCPFCCCFGFVCVYTYLNSGPPRCLFTSVNFRVIPPVQRNTLCHIFQQQQKKRYNVKTGLKSSTSLLCWFIPERQKNRQSCQRPFFNSPVAVVVNRPESLFHPGAIDGNQLNFFPPYLRPSALLFIQSAGQTALRALEWWFTQSLVRP